MPDAANKPAYAFFAQFVGHFEQVGVEADILVDREFFVEAEPLRHIAQVRLAGLGVGHDIDAVDEDAAAVRLHHAGQHPHGRGLAGAVGTDQAENLAAVDGERQTVHGGNLGKPLGQSIGRDDG